MQVRQMESNDIDQVAELFDQYRVFYHKESDLAGSLQFIKERFEKKDSVIFVAIDSDKAIGFAQLYPSYSSVALKKLWIFNDLYVVESKRREGVAMKLMDVAEDFARNSGARGMTLKTAVNNYRAQRLYEKRKWLKEESFFTYNLKFK